MWQLTTDESQHRNADDSPESLRLGFETCCLTLLALNEVNQETNLLFLMLHCFHQKLIKLGLIVLVAADDERMSKRQNRNATWFRKILLNFAGIK